jgi:hypothetical protein
VAIAAEIITATDLFFLIFCSLSRYRGDRLFKKIRLLNEPRSASTPWRQQFEEGKNKNNFPPLSGHIFDDLWVGINQKVDKEYQ